MRFFSILLLVASLFAACAAPQATSTTDTITVEGTVTYRGNEPFSALVLETDQRNLYVLNVDDMQADAIASNTPMRVRATGTLYRDEWNGQPIAHLRVRTLFDLSGASPQ